MPSNLKLIASATLFLSFFGQVHSFWRLQCEGIAGLGRIDPLVDPGKASGHLHTIKGSNGFSFTSTYQDLLAGSCTSCQVAQDHSSYWTAALYYQAPNGEFTLVPEVAGHLTYYKYTPCYVNGVLTQPSAMPNGLQIISGDPFQRNFTYPVPDPPQPWTGADATQQALQQKAIGFNCLNYAMPGEPSLYRHFLPTKDYIDANCPDGLRLELLFPQCWNGQDLTSPDFSSHVAFPSALLGGGTCPDGFPNVLNQIFFETIYDVAAFANQPGGQFVLSPGDPTGFGYHGDIIVAWEEGVLQAATEQCGPDLVASEVGFTGITQDCPVFDIVPVAEQQACKIPIPASIASDNIQGPAPILPGGDPVLPGPAYAKPAGPAPVAPPASATPAPVATPVSVPTLSYSAGSTGSIPDSGQVFVQKTATTLSTVTTTTSSSSSTTTIPAAPATTPIVAVQKPPVDGDLSTVATTWYTKGQEAYEVIVVAEEVTVTVGGAGPTPAPQRRSADGSVEKREARHLEAHRRHRHHVRRES